MRQRDGSLTCVEKLHANETREQFYDLRQKQVIRAIGLSKQCTDTYRDSHDATRHKLRRTLAYSFQQYHLPFHLLFFTLDLFSQDSQCDPTEEHHSNICLELHMYHLCACLVNRYSLWFRITKCVQPHWRPDGSLVGIVWRTSGRDETWFAQVQISSQKTTWRTMESTWNDRSSRGRSGILTWKWILEYLDQLWNHVRDEGMPTATASMEIPTVPPLAPPPEEYISEIRVHSNSGGGDVAAKMKMVICGSSYADPTKTKVTDRVVQIHKYSWSTYFIPAERGRQNDRYWPDHHCTDTTGTQERTPTWWWYRGGIVSLLRTGTLSFVPSQRHLKNSGHRSRKWWWSREEKLSIHEYL